MVPTMWNWFGELLPDDGSVTVENLSDETSIIALQGQIQEKFSPLHWVEKIHWALQVLQIAPNVGTTG